MIQDCDGDWMGLLYCVGDWFCAGQGGFLVLVVPLWGVAVELDGMSPVWLCCQINSVTDANGENQGIVGAGKLLCLFIDSYSLSPSVIPAIISFRVLSRSSQFQSKLQDRLFVYLFPAPPLPFLSPTPCDKAAVGDFFLSLHCICATHLSPFASHSPPLLPFFSFLSLSIPPFCSYVCCCQRLSFLQNKLVYIVAQQLGTPFGIAIANIAANSKNPLTDIGAELLPGYRASFYACTSIAGVGLVFTVLFAANSDPGKVEDSDVVVVEEGGSVGTVMGDEEKQY